MRQAFLFASVIGLSVLELVTGESKVEELHSRNFEEKTHGKTVFIK